MMAISNRLQVRSQLVVLKLLGGVIIIGIITTKLQTSCRDHRVR